MSVKMLTAVIVVLGLALPLAGPAGQAAPAAPSGAQRFVIVPGESAATYRVGEVFINEGNRYNLAVGTTSAIRGEVVIDRANPRTTRIGPIVVDISQFRSDRARRDNAIRDRWLESARYPMAEFTSTAIEGLPEAYAEGRELNLRVSGTLKIRDVTRPTVFATTVKLNGSVLTGAAAATIKMTDFGFDPPSILGLLRAENEATLEFRFVARAE